MKHTLLATFAGILSGTLALASLSGGTFAVLFLSLVHTLPLFYAGLSLGTRPAMIASATSVLILSLASPHFGVVFGLMYAVPVWLIVRLTLSGPQGVITDVAEGQDIHAPEGSENDHKGAAPRDLGWFPAGYVLAMFAAVASFFVIGGSVATGGGLEQAVKDVLQQFAELIAAQAGDASHAHGETVLQQAVMSLAPYFAGSAAAMWAVGQVINMVIAQGLLAKGGRNIRPSPRLRELALPDALSWALVVAALIALVLPGEMAFVGRNIAIVLAVPFFFLGLAVVHKLAAMTPMPGVVLSLMYLVMFFSGWLAFVITGFGILEQWVGLRSRMDQPNTED